MTQRERTTTDDADLVSVTMSKDAAKKFSRVLLKAASRVHDLERPSEDCDWLLWGVGRIASAFPADEEAPS